MRTRRNRANLVDALRVYLRDYKQQLAYVDQFEAEPDRALGVDRAAWHRAVHEFAGPAGRASTLLTRARAKYAQWGNPPTPTRPADLGQDAWELAETIDADAAEALLPELESGRVAASDAWGEFIAAVSRAQIAAGTRDPGNEIKPTKERWITFDPGSFKMPSLPSLPSIGAGASKMLSGLSSLAVLALLALVAWRFAK